MDFKTPRRTYPVLQAKRTWSLRLNWVPWVRPKFGLPGWPHVMAEKEKDNQGYDLKMRTDDQWRQKSGFCLEMTVHSESQRSCAATLSVCLLSFN